MKDCCILGIDTGGTYTDSVILRAHDKKLLAKAKALTTKENLLDGITQSLKKLSFENMEQITSVSLSTTLATNAIVEKKGCRVGAILIGKMPDGILPSENTILIQGRVDLHGNILIPINTEEILSALSDLEQSCEAIAVSGYLSVRNPAHEQEVRTILQSRTNLPIFCAHELSGVLGFYERTVTAILNASLTAIIKDFLISTRQALDKFSIHAPIMIVKGDGTLMQEAMALERPADTILSGPAASIIGAGFLTGVKDSLIYDMGGTTSDIAIMHNGKVSLNPDGATVDCWQTHIRAANIYTFGIGGDSHIMLHRNEQLSIGPERVEPLSVAACKNADILPVLKRILQEGKGRKTLPLYYKSGKSPDNIPMNACERTIYQSMEEPCTKEAMMEFTESRKLADSLAYLTAKGLVVKTGFTPTDLKHVQREYHAWNTDASIMGMKILLAGSKWKDQDFLRACEKTICHHIVNLCEESVEAYEQNCPAVNRVITGIGAPAKVWLPPAARELGMTLILPEHSEVANAVGAALCPICESSKAIIRYHKETDVYVLFMPDKRMEFNTREEAESYAASHLWQYSENKAKSAGATQLSTSINIKAKYMSSGEYIESVIHAISSDNERYIVTNL